MYDGMAIIVAQNGPDRRIGAEAAGVALTGPMREPQAARETATQAATEDDLLLSEVAAGDKAAFTKLMDRHLARVFSLALRVTGSRADAEDVAQEAFTRVWRKAGNWRPGAARFSTWLHRVTMNLCIDAHRRPRPEQLDPDLPVSDPAPGAEAMLLAHEQEARVRAAMAALPERQRAAMALCYTLGMSNAEAAMTMEISVKAYESLLVRAKRDIRARLEGSDR